MSGGERRRVSIGVDIIHGPSLLFLDEPTSGLDSTSAHNVIEKVHQIARAGSTVVLTIHQPSSRILLLLDHLILLARGQLMYQGSPKDVSLHLRRMGHTKIPKEENTIEYLIDIIKQYDQSEHGVEALAEFALTGVKPPPLSYNGDKSVSTVASATMTPARNKLDDSVDKKGIIRSGGNRTPLRGSENSISDFDHSLRSPYNNNNSRSWTASPSGGVSHLLKFTTSRQRPDQRMQNPIRYRKKEYKYWTSMHDLRLLLSSTIIFLIFILFDYILFFYIKILI